ncbi:hypothetical protein OG874_42460 [Nocardia sp. NBC_00565]|uniref:hypothetical protein n=1 Tax=Nocardia sp. NBC_00565 TaxID=2975993 RepID=UPI002E8095E2|nr:hypothetical protein [Nocardia sp. NBC_00565]WUC03253.1 hypothetical protein OG874_42460 [Nocardia sp. NBC_00565]
MTSDPVSPRARLLTKRAARAGYCLMRDPRSPYAWTLLDAEDGTCVHSAATLDLIEQWLSE